MFVCSLLVKSFFIVAVRDLGFNFYLSQLYIFAFYVSKFSSSTSKIKYMYILWNLIILYNGPQCCFRTFILYCAQCLSWQHLVLYIGWLFFFIFIYITINCSLFFRYLSNNDLSGNLTTLDNLTALKLLYAFQATLNISGFKSYSMLFMIIISLALLQGYNRKQKYFDCPPS